MRRIKSRFPQDELEEDEPLSDFSSGPPSQLAWVRALDGAAQLNDRPTPGVTRKRSWRDMIGFGKGAKVKGPFTAAEDELLIAQLNKLFHLQGWTWEEGIERMLKEKKHGRKGPERSSWLFISEVLPDRRIESVIQRVQGHIYPWPRKGRWTEEENKRLVQLYEQYPGKWRVLSSHLKRYWRTIRDHHNEMVAKDMISVFKQLCENPRQELKRRTRRLWTPDEEAALLKSIRNVTGLQYPLTHIPWLFVAATTRAEIPNRTASEIRLHYNLALLPRAATVQSWKDVCKRQGLRHLKKMIKARNDIHWSEVDFSGALPFWPKTTMKSRMRAVLLDFGGFTARQMDTDRAAQFLYDGSWRQVVKDAARALDLRRWRVEDYKAIEAYLARLREFNGGDRHALGVLPHDTEAEALRNYSRRKLRELKAFEVSRQTAKVESGWRARQAEGASSTDEYINYHLEAAFDLIDAGEVIVDQPIKGRAQKDPDGEKTDNNETLEVQVSTNGPGSDNELLRDLEPVNGKHTEITEVQVSANERAAGVEITEVQVPVTEHTSRSEAVAVQRPANIDDENSMGDDVPAEEEEADSRAIEVRVHRPKSVAMTEHVDERGMHGREMSVEESTPSTQAGSSPFVVIPAYDEDEDDRFFYS